MAVLGSRHIVCMVIISVLTLGNVAPDTWPFLNLCPQRGAFPMKPGCRLFCLCLRPGGAGRLLACPEEYRFNHEEERCTKDLEVCQTHDLCDPPILLEKAEKLVIKDVLSECHNTGMSYCANRWELIVCHPVWSHVLGIIECDPKGDGSHVCNLLTDTCERNRTSTWEQLGIIDTSIFGKPDEKCDSANVSDFVEYPEDTSIFSTLCCPPTLCRPTVSTTPRGSLASFTKSTANTHDTAATNATATNAAVTDETNTTDTRFEGPSGSATTAMTAETAETTTACYNETEYPDTATTTVMEPDDENDPCHLIGEWPNTECKAMGSWCLPDSETIVTCGQKRQIRQVRNCKTEFAKYDLEGVCLPLVFGCAYWQLNPVSDDWVPGRSEHEADHQHEAFEGWFREHWCKTHGRRGVLCTPDGQSLAHCNESLIVDSVFHCGSIVPKGLLLGCQFCEPGTAFCIYRPRADLADNCGIPGPKDDHDVACGFLPRKGRSSSHDVKHRKSSVPYRTNSTTENTIKSPTDTNVTCTEDSGP